MEALINFLMFGCTHGIISRPMCCRQTCLSCGAYRFHNYHRIGEWHRPKPSRKVAA